MYDFLYIYLSVNFDYFDQLISAKNQKSLHNQLANQMKQKRVTKSKQPSNQADPQYKTGDWMQDEHQRFLAGYHIYGKQWNKVAQEVKTRSVSQVRSHAQKFFKRVTNDNEKKAAQSVKIRGQNDVAITRSKARQNSQQKKSEDPQPNPEKTKKIRKDSDKPIKRENANQTKKMKKQKIVPQVPTPHRIYIPTAIMNIQYPKPSQNQSEKSFYSYPMCGNQLIISPQCSFSLYGSQTNSSEPPRGMTILEREISKNYDMK